MTTDVELSRHYGHGNLLAAILEALAAAGRDIERIATIDLAGVDEFHQGGRKATAALAADLGLVAGMRVLDVGSGLGGPARHLAESFGCHVTGIDLTPEYVDVANALSARCGLADKTSFVVGSALDLPFSDASFDAAIMLHVGMNIADKKRVFEQVRRVLKPGGRFGVYDVTSCEPERINYPVPWSSVPQTSFVASPDDYQRLLREAGFEVEAVHDRTEMCKQVARQRAAAVSSGNPPPLGQHILMGAAVKDRQRNITEALEAGVNAPVAFIARAV